MIPSERYCLSCGAANSPAAISCFACGRSLKITMPLVETTNNNHLLQQRYRILSQVGKGGFSAVYRAEDTHYSDHPVAIKAIALNGLKPQEMIEATDAFNREMMLLSALKHPYLPRIYHHFSETECWYLVMDFIEGSTLEKHLEKMPDGRLPIGEVLELGSLLCSVLDYLHTRQPPIIFRDLKPANIMLKPDGRIALIDFGIARQFKPGQAKDTIPFGSPGYAAPEQYGKAQTTLRTDIYSLGVLLHQLITGNDPSQNPFHFAPLQLQDQPELVGLEPLIMQMVEVDATQRPESIAFVKQQLARIATAWSGKYIYGGLQVQAPPTISKPSVASLSWQSLVSSPLPSHTISTSASATTQGTWVGKGQMLILQPGTSGSSASNAASSPPYWATPPQKLRNWMAIASFSLGFVTIFMPCVTFSLANSPLTEALREEPRLSTLMFAILTLAPAILTIVFGHIGRQRANTVPGLASSKDIAAAGLALGYVFGLIYLAFLCTFFAVFMR